MPYHHAILFLCLERMTMRTKRNEMGRLRRGSTVGAEFRNMTIFCEGKNTEPTYFRALRDAYSSVPLAMEVVEGVGVPFTIASKAVAKVKEDHIGRYARRTETGTDDQVWAVFDRDEHPRYQEAVSLCQQHGVHVARSNPCFELWLILHERDYDRPNSRKRVQSDLEQLRPEYHARRGKTPDCDDLVKRVVKAEGRAKRQLRNRELDGSPFGNPSTTVGLLTRQIRGEASS